MSDISIFDSNATRIAKLRAWAATTETGLCYGCDQVRNDCNRMQIADDTGLFTALVCAACQDTP